MRVLVTGGNGHLGWNLVCALRERGHRVRATVRSLADPARTSRLRALGDVELAEADVTDAARLRAALEEVEVLFHVAAVFSLVEPGREGEIHDAAVRGTEVALRSAADAGVRKVVLTSSIVTLPLTAPGAPPSTEADWTTGLRVPYFRAKVEAERLAWRLADELRLRLVALLPGNIIGPGFARNTPTIDMIEAALGGAFRLGVPDGNLSLVDVRDVAAAHVAAAERDVLGRFVVSDVHRTFAALVEALRAVDARVKRPLVNLPAFAAPMLPLFDRLNHRMLGTPRIASPELIATAVSGRRFNVSSARARAELGWAPAVPFERSLRDTVDGIRALRAAASHPAAGAMPGASPA